MNQNYSKSSHTNCPYKEKAEKWDRATDGTTYNLFTKYRLTYERLKKRIEQIESYHGSVDFLEPVLPELQKILDEGK